MASNVLMPQLGESIAEGTIVRWNKNVGDAIDRDEPLFEISTDKVDAEIPSPTAGVLAEIRVHVGETVPVDSVVAVIAQDQDAQTPAAGEPASVGSTPSVAVPAADALAPTQARSGRRAGVSPLVRKLAREHRVDVAAIAGTGAGGRVTKADVLEYVERTRTAGAGVGPPPAGEVAVAETTRVEPMSVMRRRIADHMVRSRRTSAHVHTVFDVDFSRVAQLRAEKAAAYEQAGTKLTYLTFIAKAVIDAIGQMPVINASVDETGDQVVHKRDVNLGVAVALDWGLVVPVIRRAAERSLTELSAAFIDLASRARAKQLRPEDVQGGTFTITNPGVFGSIFGMPIINQPQAAILCVGAIEKRPVVVDDAIVARPRCYLTLGFDHRLIDGAVADRFMSIVKAGLEEFDASVL